MRLSGYLAAQLPVPGDSQAGLAVTQLGRRPPQTPGSAAACVWFSYIGCGEAKRRAPKISDAEHVLELLRLLLTAVLAWVRPRQDLVLENLLLRHQLAVLTRPTRTRPRARLRASDKLLWVLARRFCAGWREHLAFVTPETVVRWHRQGWRLFWCWESCSRGGRPHLSPEVRDLTVTLSRDNRRWGTERIRGELLKLGSAVSDRSIRRYRWRGPRRPSSQTWRTFLRNHAHHLGGRPDHRTHLHFQDAGRAGVHRPRSARVGARRRDGQSDGCLGLAAGDRGDALGPHATPSAPRSRCGLWPRLPCTCRACRHRRHRDTRSLAACERGR